MSKPKIIKVSYSDENLPNESAILLYRLLEKMIVESLPSDPFLLGLFLNGSLEEFNHLLNKEDMEKNEKCLTKTIEKTNSRLRKN